MNYTSWTTYIDALKAATVNGDLTTIKANMQSDMTDAGLNSDLVDQVDAWLDQIINANSFNKNFELMNNAGSLFVIYMGYNPPESAFPVVINDIVVIAPAASTSGAVTTLTVTNPANTGQTASAEIPSFLYTTGSRQWATGAITTQREFNITAPTYSFVAASTITNAYTLYVSQPIAGTNATITNSWAAGFDGDVSFANGGVVITAEAAGASIPLRVVGDATNNADVRLEGVNNSRFILRNTTGPANWYLGNNVLNNSFAIGSTSNPAAGAYIISSAETHTWSGAVQTSGALNSFTFTKPANTNQTLSTEISGFLFTAGTRQWATGAITTQREFQITGPTYSFVGASTITTAATMSVTAPTAGTNATITNNYAAIFSGGVGVLNDLQLGSITTRVTTTFLQVAAGTTAKSQINLAASTAPTAPVNGDIWFDGTDLKIRVAGATKTFTIV